MHKRLLIIVGNGLSIDLHRHLGLKIHPSQPFSFELADPFDSSASLLDTLTRVRRLITSNIGTTDFDIIQNFIATPNLNDVEKEWTHYELRQYLALAYSYARNILLDKWKDEWKWEKWVRANCTRIVGIVSLNYDLVLESALNRLSIKYFRIGSNEQDDPVGIPIFKPHGSCDFDISNKAISMPVLSRLINLTFLNDYCIAGQGRIQIVPKDELLQPRTEADIVLPFEFSPQMNLTWVRQGYETISQIAGKVDSLIIVGLSYQQCDRNEVDLILHELPAGVDIKLVDPRQNPSFERKLREVSDKVARISPEVFFCDLT